MEPRGAEGDGRLGEGGGWKVTGGDFVIIDASRGGGEAGGGEALGCDGGGDECGPRGEGGGEVGGEGGGGGICSGGGGESLEGGGTYELASGGDSIGGRIDGRIGITGLGGPLG